MGKGMVLSVIIKYCGTRRCRIRAGNTHTDIDGLRAEIKIDGCRTQWQSRGLLCCFHKMHYKLYRPLAI